MSCRELSDNQLWELLDNELTTDQRQVVERHIAHCPRCLATFREMRARPLPLGQLHLIAPPAGFQRRVMSRLLQAQRQAEAARQLGWLAPLLAPARQVAVTASALVVALIGVTTVGAVLAGPVVEGAAGASPPLADNMRLAVSQALVVLGPFFQTWGWSIIGLSMVSALAIPLVATVRSRRPPRR